MAGKSNLSRGVLYENIAFLHQYNIVHQDIKPDNIMFSPTYKKTVLIDYGLSKPIDEKIG